MVVVAVVPVGYFITLINLFKEIYSMVSLSVLVDLRTVLALILILEQPAHMVVELVQAVLVVAVVVVDTRVCRVSTD
jgi:hypothetical protein